MYPMSGSNFIQLHHFFEKSVDDYPSNIALICDNVSISFQELECRANQLAHYLYQQNINNSSIIGIFLERSVQCYVAILAILKTGAAYVPIEVDYPDERVNYIFSDLPFDLVLTSSNQADKALLWPKKVILDNLTAELANQPTERFKTTYAKSDEANLCYVIYTSGSTGKPKGVEISHSNICHYVYTASQLYGITPIDKVYQGFSLAFDASLEEMWMAFANGATLVACTDKEVRSGLGLISFLTQYSISVFSTVPTLLATLEAQLPELRLLILGGELCPANLVKQWSRPGLKIMNTYGPTEATVVATAALCHPEKTVTIGKPLPGYEIVLLNEKLVEVEPGEAGELCIGGPTLARGYVNKPEHTSKQFIINPTNNSQRLYRTGDIAMRDSNGDLHFMGRIDDQVKLRGFRIELSEIELVMMEYPEVKQAVVVLQTEEQSSLVAYLVLNKNGNFNVTEFQSFLREKLPDYMQPAAIEVLESFPLLISGKVDKKALPKPSKTISNKPYKPANNNLQKNITRVWEGVLNCSAISIYDDFFFDLGGHSLHAASIISKLRKISELKTISILDLYKNPTIEQLAEQFINCVGETHSVEDKEADIKYIAPKWKYYACGLAQLFGILFQYAVGSWQLLAVYLFYLWNSSEYSQLTSSSRMELVVAFFLLPLFSMLLPIALKWILLGQVKPGKYPLWGWFYLRWWFVHRLVGSSLPYKHMAGTPLMSWYYRLLGAKIGVNCYIGTKDIFTHDLVNIGDNTALGIESKLNGYIVEDGWLKLGSISIGENCYVGSRSVLGLNVQIEDDVVLEEMSLLPDNSFVPSDVYCAGSPAKLGVIPANHVTKKKIFSKNTSLLGACTLGILYYVGVFFLMSVSVLSFLPGLSLVDYFYSQGNFLSALLITPVAAIICLLVNYICIVFSKKLILDKVAPGQYSLKSLYYFRYWLTLGLIDTDLVSVMSDSLYLPMFLRTLGAKLGKNVEMGEAPLITPELVTIEEGGFTASSVALGWPQIYQDFVHFSPVTIGKRAFAGNVSFLPAGAVIGDGGLLGCLSITPADNKAANLNSAWLGSPAMYLPQRELFPGYSEEQTYKPSRKLYALRLFIELIRIIIPTTCSLIILFALIYAMEFLVKKCSLLATILLLPVAELGIIAGLISALIGLKWLLQGRLAPIAKPLWDIFIWKNDLVEFTYGYFMCPYFVDQALGTPFVHWVPRGLGAKIGKQVFSDTNALAEFDLISIGDYSCINNHTLIQTHLYEDRIYKMSHLTIGSGCNVGVGSIILYNTLMEQNSSLGSLSLLMKGECLPENTKWAGIPAQTVPVSASLSVSIEDMINVPAELEALS